MMPIRILGVFPLLLPDAPKQGGGATSGFHTIFKTGFLKDLRLLQNKGGPKDMG